MNKMIKEKNYNFFVEFDIKYPKELYDLHNDYPLAPERMVIDNKFKMSKYQGNIIKNLRENTM